MKKLYLWTINEIIARFYEIIFSKSLFGSGTNGKNFTKEWYNAKSITKVPKQEEQHPIEIKRPVRKSKHRP